MKLPSTSQRVERNTGTEPNRRIDSRTWADIDRFGNSTPAELSRRIKQLDREWDTERVLETNFAIMSLLCIGLGYAFDNKKWFAVSAAASAFLLQHALQGWCPPLTAVRHLGIRTAAEIEEEKTILKFWRGDYGECRNSSVGRKPSRLHSRYPKTIDSPARLDPRASSHPKRNSLQ